MPSSYNAKANKNSTKTKSHMKPLSFFTTILLCLFFLHASSQQYNMKGWFYNPESRNGPSSVEVEFSYRFVNVMGTINLMGDATCSSGRGFNYNGSQWLIDESMDVKADDPTIKCVVNGPNGFSKEVTLSINTGMGSAGIFGNSVEIKTAETDAERDASNFTISSIEVTYVAFGSYTHIINQLEKTLAKRNEEKVVKDLFAMASGYETSRDYQSAVDAYQKIIDLQPDNERAAEYLAKAQKAVDSQKSKESFNEFMNKGSEAEARGNLKDALQAYEQAAAAYTYDTSADTAIERVKKRIEDEKNKKEDLSKAEHNLQDPGCRFNPLRENSSATSCPRCRKIDSENEEAKQVENNRREQERIKKEEEERIRREEKERIEREKLEAERKRKEEEELRKRLAEEEAQRKKEEEVLAAKKRVESLLSQLNKGGASGTFYLDNYIAELKEGYKNNSYQIKLLDSVLFEIQDDEKTTKQLYRLEGTNYFIIRHNYKSQDYNYNYKNNTFQLVNPFGEVVTIDGESWFNAIYKRDEVVHFRRVDSPFTQAHEESTRWGDKHDKDIYSNLAELVQAHEKILKAELENWKAQNYKGTQLVMRGDILYGAPGKYITTDEKLNIIKTAKGYVYNYL